MQVPVLDSNGNQQPTNKKHVGIFQVLDTNLEKGGKIKNRDIQTGSCESVILIVWYLDRVQRLSD